MDNSYILKQNIQQERKIALALDKGVAGVYEGAINTSNAIYSGFERLSWRTSCFIDGYEDVCQELKKEDKRFRLAIAELYKKRDIILYMIVLYIEFVLDDKDRTEREVRAKTKSTSKLLADLSAGIVTRKAIAYTIGKSLSDSPQVRASIRKNIYTKGTIALTIIGYYGQVQKAAMAARKLRMLEPGYYNILYANNIEMLYIFVDPLITSMIKSLKYKYNATLEEKIEILEMMGNL